MVLCHVGHEVVTAGNGKEALWEAGRSNSSLLITDVLMPEINGLDLIMALRQRQLADQFAAYKVVLLSLGGR